MKAAVKTSESGNRVYNALVRFLNVHYQIAPIDRCLTELQQELHRQGKYSEKVIHLHHDFQLFRMDFLKFYMENQGCFDYTDYSVLLDVQEYPWEGIYRRLKERLQDMLPQEGYRWSVWRKELRMKEVA